MLGAWACIGQDHGLLRPDRLVTKQIFQHAAGIRPPIGIAVGRRRPKCHDLHVLLVGFCAFQGDAEVIALQGLMLVKHSVRGVAVQIKQRKLHVKNSLISAF